MKRLEIAAVILFAVLTIAGVSITVFSSFFPGPSQIILVGVGSAIFAGALAFFLIEMFKWVRDES